MDLLNTGKKPNLLCCKTYTSEAIDVEGGVADKNSMPSNLKAFILSTSKKY